MKGNNSMKVCLDENVLLDSKQVELLFEILHTNSPSGCEHQIVKNLQQINNNPTSVFTLSATN